MSNWPAAQYSIKSRLVTSALRSAERDTSIHRTSTASMMGMDFLRNLLFMMEGPSAVDSRPPPPISLLHGRSSSLEPDSHFILIYEPPPGVLPKHADQWPIEGNQSRIDSIMIQQGGRAGAGGTQADILIPELGAVEIAGAGQGHGLFRDGMIGR